MLFVAMGQAKLLMVETTVKKGSVVIKFAGDSGDGMQLLGYRFTSNTALHGYDVTNFPDFPSEIRAPRGTLGGVSGFQLHFGSVEIDTPGDEYDVLVAMNAAALKTNLDHLKPNGIIITDIEGFSAKNIKLAKYDENPLEGDALDNYEVHKIDITGLTREALSDTGLGMKERDRSRNMFVLGFLCWLYDRDLSDSIEFFETKFARKEVVRDANIKALKTGHAFAETSEVFTSRYKIEKAVMPAGRYRGITGSHATVLGLVAASERSGLPMFYGSYPITPASDILHGLARYKNFNVITYQAEDEIAAICSAIGASYGGGLAVTGTSGPGMALKTEALGLAVMMETPLVIINVQRAGPSTGMPTKTEQSDLLQALYGRNGEAPIPVLAISKPSDSFETTFEACRIALQHMTPVIVLSDGYIANGAEPWKYPKSADLPHIKTKLIAAKENGDPFYPYERDEDLVRPWAVPGTKGLEHRVGGLEKEELTGNVSYDPDNHHRMVKLRAEKVNKIADSISDQKIEVGKEKGKILVLGWGSTYGSIKLAVRELNKDDYEVSHVHLRYIEPFPKNLHSILQNFDKVLIPELNNGQLIKVIREKFLIDAVGLHKIKGKPFKQTEIKDKVKEMLA